MKKILALTFIGLGIAFVGASTGCGKGNSGSGGGSNASTTTGQTCSSAHLCVNGVCNCGADGKGASCPDAMTCETQCKVCM